MDVIGWATSNVSLVLTGLLALVVLVWLAQAVEEAEDRAEALTEFGGKAKSGTGGTLNLLLVAFLAVAGWGATTFATVGEFGLFLLSMAPDFPVVAGSIITISLGAIGLTDVIVLGALEFVVIAAAILFLAVAYRRGFGEGGLL